MATTATSTPATRPTVRRRRGKAERQRHLELGLDPRDLVHLEVHPEVLEFGGYRTQPTIIDGLSID